MNNRLFAIAAIALSSIAVGLLVSHPTSAAQSSPMNLHLAQGKYLVTSIAGCMDCHGANLHGAPLPFGPVVKFPPGVHWAKLAPNIVTLIGSGSAAKWARFLETGVDPNGHRANVPMPQFRMKASDAQAVVAYIRSLK